MAAALLGVALCCTANLPPEHGHPADRSRQAVVHRHASLHVVRHTSRPTLADDDGQIIWIDGSYLAGTAAATASQVGERAVRVSVPPDLTVELVVREIPLGQIHDPPGRVAGSRGPPSPSSL
jgi:hypothetical protein